MDDPRTRWNTRHAARPGIAAPARFLTDRVPLLPPGGRALDVAGGSGRHALWLAERGFTVTLLDASDIAVERAAAAADAAGLPVQAHRQEITVGSLPDGPFDVVVVHHFLDREVYAALPARLAAGGVLLVCQPTMRNLQRHPRPGRRWLLAEGEVAALADRLVAVDPDLEIVEASEGWSAEGRHEGRSTGGRTDGWSAEGRHEARLVLRRRPS